MNKIKIGIIREGKIPPDKRSPFTPKQAQEIQQRFPNVEICVETSPLRCFSDREYQELGIEVVPEVSGCDVLMGIKEVPINWLLDNKTYFFFSHTIKKQPYNRKLLQQVLRKNIRLIDYEVLKDRLGNRLVAFGRYAGIVGAYNGLWTFGRRNRIFDIRRAFECFDINDLKLEIRKIKLPAIKIVLTGAGRVAKGAMETLDTAGVRKVMPHDFLHVQYNEPVYVQLSSADYHTRKDGGSFNREEFHTNPERYDANFLPFLKVADVLLAGAYWNPKAPVLFTREDMQTPEFKTKVIADITCDINGSVPSTIRASSIVDPVYDVDPETCEVKEPFSDERNISVMAIDNLPCELPRSSSEEFGRDFIDKVLPLLIGDDKAHVIDRATIASKNALTKHFRYLQDYVDGNP